MAQKTPSPKIDNPLHEQDLRTISILPTMLKIFERLVHHQVIEYIDIRTLFKNNISGHRKGHSTATVLLGKRNDIAKAMKRGEVTLVVLADYSKAFETIKFTTVLGKINSLGFSKLFLHWTVNYLTNRKHFVQIDDKRSEMSMVYFGVLQGSILGTVIFNIYVSDPQACIGQSSDLTVSSVW